MEPDDTRMQQDATVVQQDASRTQPGRDGTQQDATLTQRDATAVRAVSALPGDQFLATRDRRLSLIWATGAEKSFFASAALVQTLRGDAKDREIYATLLEVAGIQMPQGYELSSHQLAVWTIDRHPKPFVALLSDDAAGDALGLALHGTQCVATETARLCASSITTGDTPSGGLSLILPRLPGHLGLYLSLSGRLIDRSLAYRAGLITHCIDATHFPEIRERLAQADPVDDILDGLHQTPGPSPLDPYLPIIDACFAAPSPEDIVARLLTVAGPEAAWAHDLAHHISGFSASALDATHRMLTDVPAPDLRSALALEYRIAMARQGHPGATLDLPQPPRAPSIS